MDQMPNVPPKIPQDIPHIDVACGVVVDRDGRVLLAQRPSGKIAAGTWEFPGGKIEVGESAERALRRELNEEIGIVVQSATPLLRFTHCYVERCVTLHCWRVDDFVGEAEAREGQTLRWWQADTLAEAVADGALAALPTVAPILATLKLPRHYVFTPAEADGPWIASRLSSLPRGALLRLRLPRLERGAYLDLARHLMPACAAAGLRLMLDRDADMVAEIGAAGWHATQARLLALESRPAGCGLFAVSVHDAGSLAAAAKLRADCAVLGTVQATASHPGVEGIGWSRFSALIDRAGLAVFAIGGLAPTDLDAALTAGAFGVAGIGAFWKAAER